MPAQIEPISILFSSALSSGQEIGVRLDFHRSNAWRLERAQFESDPNFPKPIGSATISTSKGAMSDHTAAWRGTGRIGFARSDSLDVGAVQLLSAAWR